MNNPNEKSNQLKPSAELLGHEYDGIRELDYPLPRWWLWIFYLTIAFAIVYCAYYLTGIGPGLRDELDVAMKDIASKQPQQPSSGLNDAAVLAILKDPAKLHAGEEVFEGKCIPCHGNKGQGGIGPNLTDDYWLHGQGTPSEIAAIIRDGVPDKGMPTWGAVLKADELIAVAAFVRSLHGTNPTGAKSAQGDLREFKAF